MNMKRIGLVSAAGAAGALGSVSLLAGFAHNIAFPHRLTLEQEMKWEVEHGFGDMYARVEKDSYTVKGWNEYELNCMCLWNDFNSRKFVILTHGYTSNRLGTLKYIDCYMDLGYNCIIYDVRGHGENKKSAVSLGQFEAKDLLAVIEDSYSRYGEDIELGLHGESMGSAISMCVLQYQPNVKFVVEDCGFANLYELIKELYDARHMGWLLPAVNAAMKACYGYDMHATSPIDAVAHTDIPVCFIHGADDNYIKPHHAQELKDACSSYCELHYVDGAHHAQSRATAGRENYTTIIESFLKNAKIL